MTPGREAERVARAALCRLGEPGDPRMAHLVAELGAQRLYQSLVSERDVGGLLTDVAVRLGAVHPERDLDNADRLGIRFLIPGDSEWPASLDQLQSAPALSSRGGAPLGLWVRGAIPLNEIERSVAIVGSRSATTYGLGVAGDLAAGVARAGFAVISGGAYGIDQAAHRGALGVRGRTVAVLACGVDRAYPAAHKPLFDHLVGVGALVSESPPGCAPTKLRFLSRNRLIAGLARGSVIVEAALRSGALNTSTWTQGLNRPVMGVPGPITSAPSQGVHQLLREGAATLVTTDSDILETVSRAGEHLADIPRGEARRADRFTVRQRQVLDAVPVHRGVAADSVARSAGMGLVEVRSALTRLAEAGLVEFSESGWRLTSEARSA